MEIGKAPKIVLDFAMAWEQPRNKPVDGVSKLPSLHSPNVASVNACRNLSGPNLLRKMYSKFQVADYTRLHGVRKAAK